MSVIPLCINWSWKLVLNQQTNWSNEGNLHCRLGFEDPQRFLAFSLYREMVLNTPIISENCIWKTVRSGQPEEQSWPCMVVWDWKRWRRDLVGKDPWGWEPEEHVLWHRAQGSPCEVALGAPLVPSVSASVLSLCPDGLWCVKHRAELPGAWISAAIKLFLWFTTFKIFCVVRETGLVQNPFFLRSLVCLSLPSRTVHGVSHFPSPALLHTQERESGHWSHNLGILFGNCQHQTSSGVSWFELLQPHCYSCLPQQVYLRVCTALLPNPAVLPF